MNRLKKGLPAALAAVVGLVAEAHAETWFVVAGHEGCVPISVLFRKEQRTSYPASPEEYAAEMRQRGLDARIVPMPGAPAELAGKLVQVQLGKEKAPVFATESVCRNMDHGR